MLTHLVKCLSATNLPNAYKPSALSAVSQCSRAHCQKLGRFRLLTQVESQALDSAIMKAQLDQHQNWLHPCIQTSTQICAVFKIGRIPEPHNQQTQAACMAV